MASNKVFVSLCIILFSTSIRPSFAQNRFTNLVRSGPEDATRLAQAYLDPLFRGFGMGLNSGWNNTANAKNLARFELRIGLTGAFVSPGDKTFDVTQIGLSNNIRPVNASQTTTPSLAGRKNNGPQMAIFDDNNEELERFTLPSGQKLSIIPAPQVQGTIGIGRGLDVTVRAMPRVNLGNDVGSIGMVGGGVKVELIRLLAGKTVNKLVPLDVALAFGYSQFNYSLPLDVRPQSNAVPENAQQSQDFSGQKVDARVSGINIEGIVSKKLLVFTPFISVGYNSSKTNASLDGNYPITTGANLLGQRTYTTFANPVNINRNYVNGLRTNLGFQLNLAVFRLYASYSLGRYNAASAGIGLGFGK